MDPSAIISHMIISDERGLKSTKSSKSVDTISISKSSKSTTKSSANKDSSEGDNPIAHQFSGERK